VLHASGGLRAVIVRYIVNIQKVVLDYVLVLLQWFLASYGVDLGELLGEEAGGLWPLELFELRFVIH
jgi:hypothetical protein